MKLRCLLFALGLLQIPAAGCSQTKGNQTALPGDTAPLVLAEWNAYASRPTFQQPFSVAADPEGNIFVLDATKGNVLRFTTDGTFVSFWNVPYPFEDRRARTLNALAASKDAVYVSDPAGLCIHRFTPDGKPKGTVPFEAGLNGLAVDPLGNLYVAGFQTLGADTVIFEFPPAMGVPPDTSLEAAREGPALWKLNRLGDVLKRWDRRAGPLAVDRQGTLFAATEIYEDGPFSILRLDPAGGRISEWEVASLPPLGFIQGIAVDSRGHVFLTTRLKSEPTDDDPKVRFNKRAIVELDAKGNWTRDWTSAGPDRRPILEPGGVAVDNSGYLYVTDWAVSRVVKYDPRKIP